MPSDARKRPGLRTLRHLARARLLVGVGDVAHALAGDRGELRARLEHDDAGVGQLPRASTRA